MNRISQKKLIVSYFLSTSGILFISAFIHYSGLFNQQLGTVIGLSPTTSTLFHLAVVMVLNLLLHGVFYFGGFNSSPLAKGVITGCFLGALYFFFALFVFNGDQITTAPLSHVLSSLSKNLVEYGSGGVLTAIISVSNIHKWGLMRAF